MTIFKLLANATARGFYAWAWRDISPSHPDVPEIVIKRLMLEDEWKSLWTPPRAPRQQGNAGRR